MRLLVTNERRNIMNILLAINNNYVEQTITLLSSIKENHTRDKINIFILNKDLKQKEKNKIKTCFNNTNIYIKFITINDNEINNFPVLEKRYPVEIYFRLFATKYLPKNIDRILYMDVDTIVINPLEDFYNMYFDGNLFIGATHVNNFFKKFNQLRLKLPKNSDYINSGVLLMNIKQLRNVDIENDVKQYIKNNKGKLLLPDQDLLNALYGNRIKLVSYLKYNLGDKTIKQYNRFNKEKIDIDWIKKNTVIIHYYGRNKPWNKNYKGMLDSFYNYYLKQ